MGVLEVCGHDCVCYKGQRRGGGEGNREMREAVKANERVMEREVKENELRGNGREGKWRSIEKGKGREKTKGGTFTHLCFTN